MGLVQWLFVLMGLMNVVKGSDPVYPIGAPNNTICVDYPLNGVQSVCSLYKPIPTKFMHLPDPKNQLFTPEDREVFMEFLIELTVTTYASLTSSSCTNMYLTYMCNLVFPDCFETENGGITIQQMCKSYCENLWQECSALFIISETRGIRLIDRCDAMVSDLTPGIFPYFKVFQEKLTWPETSTVLQFDYGQGPIEEEIPCSIPKSEELPCLDTWYCPSPFQPEYWNETSNACICGLPCPLPLWNDTDLDANEQVWEQILWAFVLPGLLSLPFNLAVFVVELAKLAGWGNFKKGSWEPMVLVCASCGILFVLVGPILALIEKFDMVCNGRGFLFTEGFYGLSVDKNLLCQVSKSSLHVLQAFIGAVLCTLRTLYYKILLSKRMRTFRGLTFLQKVKFFIVVFVLPATFYVISVFLDVDVTAKRDHTGKLDYVDFTSGSKQYDTKLSDTVRSHFVCNTRYRTTTLEFALVHIPLFIYSIAALSQSLVLIWTVRGLRKSTVPSAGLKKRKRVSDGTARLIRTMTQFSIACSIFVVCNVVATLSFVLRITEVSKELSTWYECKVAGNVSHCPEYLELEVGGQEKYEECIENPIPIDQRDVVCGPFGGKSLPPAFGFSFMFMSQSMLPLLFGVLFSKSILLAIRKYLSSSMNYLTGTTVASTPGPSAAATS